MYAFFVSLYLALFEGNWNSLQPSAVRQQLTILIRNIFNFLLNAIGGNFDVLQDFNIFKDVIGNLENGSSIYCICLILAIVTMLGLLLAVTKVVKYIFSIFFYGWRN